MSTSYFVFLVDDDDDLRRATARLLQANGFELRAFASAEAFLAAYDPSLCGCLLLDLHMPGQSGLELQRTLAERGVSLPIVFLSGQADVSASVKAMKSGSVIVDIAIDQGGCAETSRPTTHSAPTYIVDEVVHYCVTNMPGAVARTSTFALNNVTLPFVLALADKGYRRALGEDPHLRNGLNVYEGRITCRAVADALKLKYVPPEAALRL